MAVAASTSGLLESMASRRLRNGKSIGSGIFEERALEGDEKVVVVLVDDFGFIV